MNENCDLIKPNCAFCGNPLSVSVLSDISVNEILCNVSECADCEIGMVHPFPSDQKLSNLYSTGNYRTDGGTRFNFLVEYLIYLGSVVKRKRIEKYSSKGKILDIGCGRGLFMDIMRRGGWEVEGSELNKETASYAEQAYDLKVYPGKITDHTLPPEDFEAINVCGVLEHLKEPGEVLTECYKLLKTNGLLVVLVPDIRSFEFKLGKKNWFHLDLPFHLFHFSEKGLIQLLEKKGFKIKRVKRFHLEYSPFGWLQTLLNLSKIKFNLFYDLLKSGNLRGKKMEKVKSKDIFATLVLLPIYLPLAFIFSILEPIFFSRGGIIQIYASKEKN
jgi:SAM-dependent methyltransferase